MLLKFREIGCEIKNEDEGFSKVLCCCVSGISFGSEGLCLLMIGLFVDD